MTIAVDKRTGAVIGQVTALSADPTKLIVLTREGYAHWLRTAVRLEEVR